MGANHVKPLQGGPAIQAYAHFVNACFEIGRQLNDMLVRIDYIRCPAGRWVVLGAGRAVMLREGLQLTRAAKMDEDENFIG